MIWTTRCKTRIKQDEKSFKRLPFFVIQTPLQKIDRVIDAGNRKLMVQTHLHILYNIGEVCVLNIY